MIAREKSYHRIRSELQSGRWQAGERLNPQVIANELDMSYTPVREALIQLVSEGLLEQTARQRIKVKRLDAAEFTELFDLRKIIESGAAKMAALRITDSQINEMQNICDQLNKLVSHVEQSDASTISPAWNQARLRLDMAFHNCLIAASKNTKAVKIINDMHILTSVLSSPNPLPTDQLIQHTKEIMKYHKKILGALKKHDPDKAYQAAYDHMEWAQQIMLQDFCQPKEIKINDQKILDELVTKALEG